MHTIPKLGYEYNALEPYIDAKTMEFHYSKHHQTYVDKLNTALQGQPELQQKELLDLLKNINAVPESIRAAVRNNGYQHYNHSLFWTILKKEVEFTGEIGRKVKQDFGGFDKFKLDFANSALSLFGSGWTWLVLNKGKLQIINGQNEQNFLDKNMIPLLGLDVWEHAYYLKYQNRRAEYIEAFFNVINWEQVNKNYLSA